MKSVTKKFALAALCTTALFVASQSANAAVFSIDNSVSYNAFTYGTNPADNNVINDPAAGVVDGATPTTWHASGGAGSASVSVTGLLANQTFGVQYTYLGSESGDIIRFSAPGLVNFNETNANNNCGAACGGSAQTGQSNLGTSTLAFNLTDTRAGSGASVTNGVGTNPAPAMGGANMIFSYATFNAITGVYTLTATQTDFVVFGFNDDGANDDNHDDFVGAMTLVVTNQVLNPTPIPGALPLFGSVLGGGLLFRRLRKRAKSA